SISSDSPFHTATPSLWTTSSAPWSRGTLFDVLQFGVLQLEMFQYEVMQFKVLGFAPT
ncbi:hypothetical protein Tco_0358339, partial [Tanacetum coccineum]